MQLALPSWAVPSAPLFVHLMVDRACTWHCGFCVLRSSDRSFGDCSVLSKVIQRLGEGKVLDLTFYGGEPFLHPRIRELAILARDCGMRPGFVTNGDHGFPPTLAAEIFDQGSISLHGFEAAHDAIVKKPGAFKRTVAFYKAFCEAGGKPSMCVTVSSENLPGFRDFAFYVAEHLRPLSLVVNAVISFAPEGPALDLAGIEKLSLAMIEVKRKFGLSVLFGAAVPFCAIPAEAAELASSCMAGTVFASVDPEGGLRICAERHQAIGSLLNDGLVPLWQRFSEFSLLASGRFLSSVCASCRAYPFCLGGCRSVDRGPRPTTDPRVVGPDAAERNLKHLSARPTPLGHYVRGRLPRAIRLCPGHRFRQERFGGFLVLNSGRVLSLARSEARFLRSIPKFNGGADWHEVAYSQGLPEPSVTPFVRQGLGLGVFEAVKKGGD
jgi:radical SAM protein with 4Fe4S-binding SPASM domain